MISKEAIKELARKYQTADINVWREYFQHLFLSYFYQQPETDKIYFKGGTALRIIYNSPRFSEDLDFTSVIEDAKAIEKAIIGALSEIEREGIKTEIHEAKRTTGGYLAYATFKNNSDTVKIQTEFSFRKIKGKGIKKTITTNDFKGIMMQGATATVTAIIGDFIPPYTVMQLAKEELIAEKIAALLNRKKPRDFYDLYFILRADLLPAEEKKILPEALKALKSADINFNRESKEFLPKSHWLIIRDFPATLEREIKRFIKFNSNHQKTQSF